MTATAGLGDGLVQLAHAADHTSQTEWPAGRRRAALAWVEGHGFPTRREEDWRYLPLPPILTAVLRLPDPAAGAAVAATLDSLAPDLGGPRLVFVNGCFVPGASRLVGLPVGVTVDAGWTARNDWRGAPDGDGAAEYRHAFEALNVALAGDDVQLRVAPGVIVHEPIHLVYLSDAAGEPVVASPRTRLVAGRASRVHLVEMFVGAVGVTGLTNAVTTVECGQGAQVDLDRLQDEGENRWHLSLLDVCQAEHSRFRACSVALGASVARHEVRVRLAGEGAEVSLDGLYLPRDEQHHDHPILVEHLVPNTRSRQRYQGVADEGGHGVFNGRIVVHPGARGTDAEQTNRNLLLSDRAEIDTRPRLEIFDDDVRCTHGATVGRLDAAALYYLRSRGVPHPAARAMLVHAAVDQVVDRVGSATLRVDVARRVAAAIDHSDGAP